MSKRNPALLGEWGPNGKRAIAAEPYWRKPFQWEKKARESGSRTKVFCASLADIFEDRSDLRPHRWRVFDTIFATPNLDWLLLTKRPHMIGLEIKAYADARSGICEQLAKHWLDGNPPENVWLGASVEDQERADERIPDLIDVPAVVHWLSLEPLLGPVDLGRWIHSLDWLVVGGESGSDSRPMHPRWARDLRRQAISKGVSYFFKQWGEYLPADDDSITFLEHDTRQFLPWVPGDLQGMCRLGKHRTGDLLDGRQWHQFPNPLGVEP